MEKDAELAQVQRKLENQETELRHHIYFYQLMDYLYFRKWKFENLQ